MSAPFFVSYLALINSSNFVNPLLYSNSCFHDITVGSNSIGTKGEYYAKVGYDNCTGLGSLSGLLVIPYINLQPFTIKKGFVYKIPIDTNVNVVWYYSNNVIVNKNGFILGINVGSAIITARANNLSVSTIVTVQSNLKKLLIY